jgi:arylsulfatase A-like enzyme
MPRMKWLVYLACLFAPSLILAAPPNIVVILSDDQGWGDLSINGNTNLSTPNIDSLAKSGAMLERFYVCPVCSPTRAEFFTGRYHPRGGVHGVSTGGERLNLDERTIGDVFKAAGYKTGAFGKWHNGTQYPYHPNARGFDEYYGFTSGHWGNYFDPPLDHNGALVTGHGFIVDDFTDHAMQFITANKDVPFFCYVPLNTPHSPMQVPDRFYEKFANADLKLRARNKQEELDVTRAALAMCENIDWNVGRILDKLEELKLAGNTIVVYFSDNGPNGWRWNGGMKGRKGSTDEGGVRSPFLIRWPSKIKGGLRIPQIAGAIDLLPTLTELAGVDLPPRKPLDGVSLKPLLLNESKDWPERMIFSHWNKKVSVRTQQYRLDSEGALFDMDADPGQMRDVAKDQPAIASKLSAAVADWTKEMLTKELFADGRPFPVGYPEFPLAQLPARDGVPHGNVKRSANAPNCSYFTNWTSTDDRITWDIEVAAAGLYEAVVYYTCPKADVGSEMELSFNDVHVATTVSEPHDPPLIGAEHDRAPRGGESYVKDFRPLHLGTMQLKPGRGELTLRATKVPGKSVMDVRMVLLTLKP